MAEQIEMNESITKAVAKSMRIAIETMAEVQSGIAENQRGPKLGSPALKQPQFNWEAADK